jgi:hypothetical protein
MLIEKSTAANIGRAANRKECECCSDNILACSFIVTLRQKASMVDTLTLVHPNALCSPHDVHPMMMYLVANLHISAKFDLSHAYAPSRLRFSAAIWRQLQASSASVLSR